MNDNQTNVAINEIAESIDIPISAHERAEERYKDLGKWFGRPDAKCSGFEPNIRSQGSFRLGTVVRSDEYDLDFGCRLEKNISKSSHSQEQLKKLIGYDLEDYRNARGIKSALDEKRRCWRLKYADEMSFHMDVVPSIPEDANQRAIIQERMVKFASSTTELSHRVASFAGAITDKDDANYSTISPIWRISNSEGYALWFESRMKLAHALLEKRAFESRAATIDKLPTYKWKSPLQVSIQILKRHRNIMFKDNDKCKPISIIITTLASQAYQGEQDVADSLRNILSGMGKYVLKSKPRVPNPVNPIEDFADKWSDSRYSALNLEINFWQWLEQAQTDFQIIGESSDADFIAEQANIKLATNLNLQRLKNKLGNKPVYVHQPQKNTITQTPAKPWMQIQ